MQSDTIQNMEALLEAEHGLLLRGEIVPLGAMSEEKERLLEVLADSDQVDPADLADLHRRATRNMAMIEAALRGVRSARHRLEEIRRVAENLDTYSASGTVTTHVDAPRNLERRA